MSNEFSRNTTLLILIDAFSKAYFSEKYTPFLHDLANEGLVASLEPLFAFKGIETTIFTGQWPSTHNVWTEFCFAQNMVYNGKDRLLKGITKTVGLIPNDDFVAKARYGIEKYLFQKSFQTPNLIPPAATPFFEPSQPKKITQNGAIGSLTTLFDVLRKNQLEFVFIEPSILGDRGVMRSAKRLIGQKHRCHLWYIKLNHLDHLGHKFGPKPSAFADQLSKMDTYTKEIVTLLEKETQKLDVLVFADHGMSRVHQTVNILEGLQQLKSQMYRDYVPFADSTMIRFWFFNDEAKDEVSDFLSQIKNGHVLDAEERRFLRVPLDQKYGQIIYVVDEGYVVHPCFFQSKSVPKGMHGYAYPKTFEATPILIMNGEMTKGSHVDKKVTYADISQFVFHSLVPSFSKPIFGPEIGKGLDMR